MNDLCWHVMDLVDRMAHHLTAAGECLPCGPVCSTKPVSTQQLGTLEAL